MVCDYLRSCYTTKARLHAGQPGRVSVIRWYFAPPGALPLPFQSKITSLNWIDASERTGDGIGEVPGAPRQWSNGKTPAEVTGKSPCGDPSWFVDGSPDGHYPRSPDGPLLACPLPELPMDGLRLAAGAERLADTLPPHAACCMDDDLPAVMYGRISEKAGEAGQLPDLVTFSINPPGTEPSWSYQGLDQWNGWPAGPFIPGYKLNVGCGVDPDGPNGRTWFHSMQAFGDATNGFRQASAADTVNTACSPFLRVWPVCEIADQGGEVHGTYRLELQKEPFPEPP